MRACVLAADISSCCRSLVGLLAWAFLFSVELTLCEFFSGIGFSARSLAPVRIKIDVIRIARNESLEHFISDSPRRLFAPSSHARFFGNLRSFLGSQRVSPGRSTFYPTKATQDNSGILLRHLLAGSG